LPGQRRARHRPVGFARARRAVRSAGVSDAGPAGGGTGVGGDTGVSAGNGEPARVPAAAPPRPLALRVLAAPEGLLLRARDSMTPGQRQTAALVVALA